MKIRMGMCGVSGTSLMFLSELLDGSGEWETNPGCVSSPKSNEYMGSPHLVYCEEGSEISSRYYNEKSIMFAKSYICRFLPYVECPEVYQIDISENEAYDYVFDLRFYKKYLNGDYAHPDIVKRIDESNLDLSDFPYLSKYSSPVVHWVTNNVKPSHDYVREQYLRMYDNCQLYKGGINTVKDVKDLTNIDEVDKLDCSYDLEKMEKYTKVHVIRYEELFIKGIDTNTIFDEHKDEIKSYTNRNDVLLNSFFDCINI